MKRCLATVICLILLYASSTSGGTTADVFRVLDRSLIPFGEMIRDLKSADIIYIGELHHIKAHRQLALDIIRALHDADIPLAVGLEMFRAEDQPTLDAWTSGTLSTDRFISSYYQNWTMPWKLYDDIFLYARDHRIPLVGLNVPNNITETVAKKGFAALTEEQRKSLPRGLSCNVTPRYRTFIEQAYSRHGISSRKQFENFCEAQLVWDKSMAFHLINFRKMNPGVKMVVLAGLGHAWRSGMPEQVAREEQATSRVALPIIDGQITPSTITSRDADYLLHW